MWSTTSLPFWRWLVIRKDNLALLSTGQQEEDLEEQLPYVQEATISRHFPAPWRSTLPLPKRQPVSPAAGNGIRSAIVGRSWSSRKAPRKA